MLRADKAYIIAFFLSIMKKRGQVSVEFIVLLGVLLLFLILLVNISSDMLVGSKKTIDNSQINAFFDALENAGGNVYYQGYGARANVAVILPENVESILFNGKQMVIVAGGNRYFRNFDFNITGNLSVKGRGYVSAEAKNGYVEYSVQ